MGGEALFPRLAELSASQAVSIFGWWTPRRILTWEDVRRDARLTLPFLLSVGVTAASLRYLQPEVREWVACKGVGLADVPRMVAWPLHPIRDLGADMSDLLEQRYSAEVLRAAGVTYHELRLGAVGMGDEEMHWMRLTVEEWASLGMGRADVEQHMSDWACVRVFGVGQKLLLQSPALA